MIGDPMPASTEPRFHSYLYNTPSQGPPKGDNKTINIKYGGHHPLSIFIALTNNSILEILGKGFVDGRCGMILKEETTT